MRAFVAAALVALGTARPALADIGPPKHWAVFPGREVHAVSFRGNAFGAEPSFTVVQGRDGFVYLRGRFGLYRVRESGDESQLVADTTECGGFSESHGADARPLVPSALCSRAQDVIIAAGSWHRHLRVPYPDPAHAPYRFDGRELTGVVPAAGGGYWFAYGEKASVGRVWPSGRAALWRHPGLGRFFTIVAAGDDVYAVDQECRAVRLRGRTMATLARADGNCNWASRGIVVSRDGAVWLLREHTIERRTATGGRSRWTLRMYADDVAVTRDGTAFVLGASSRQWPSHPAIAAIAPHRAPVEAALPMERADGIAVDARDRIWITAFLDHAAAMITPPGASR